MATTKELPGIPPVPPSDMDPKIVEFARTRANALDKSIDLLVNELATIRGVSAFSARVKYCDARIKKLTVERDHFIDLIGGAK